METCVLFSLTFQRSNNIRNDKKKRKFAFFWNDNEKTKCFVHKKNPNVDIPRRVMDDFFDLSFRDGSFFVCESIYVPVIKPRQLNQYK
jgi:hypothetical protein